MPMYEYQCQRCEHQFETLVSGDESVECPKCQGRQLERLLSVPAKPPASATAMPMACNSSGPPCGPRCARW